MDIEGKTVMVTGASSGIGEEFARQLHEEGADLILVARRQVLLEQLNTEFNSKRADSSRYLVVDLADSQGSEMKQLENLLSGGEVDILVNNAGCGSFGPYEELLLENELRMVSLNVIATMRLSHFAIHGMKNKSTGSIVSISSIGAFQPLPLMATYAATKAFNFIHSMALRYELRSSGINVLTVCPGPTATEFGGVARVPGTLTGVGRTDVAIVVSKAIKGLKREKAWIIPGWYARLISIPSRFLPKTFTTKQVYKVLSDALAKSRL